MQDLIKPDSTLAELAVSHAGASRVFHKHGLDFCCNGRISLADACVKQGLDVAQLESELQAAIAETPQQELVSEKPLPDFVQYILDNFHAAHREELPRLTAMARKVEQVHGEKPDCPRGLGEFLERLTEELEMHMQKEEQMLFPMILAGRGRMVAMPISVMEEEHQDHGKNLERMRELAANFEPPEGACNTWRALYLGLAQLERDLMEHIHLENNALFPRALKG
ncbi:MAG: regulator of cell morphogenesis and NO signaling [Planctomycetota bacterium]|jgi:regulator of cell morphogenesis and NO signaling